MALWGSSPRVRGEESRLPAHPLCSGIIPAGAGRSTVRRQHWQGQRDHPRGCGEKRTSEVVAAAATGSSPRVRGEAARCASRRIRRRIIPAGAGRRALSIRRTHFTGDHPRGCGEKLIKPVEGYGDAGSSPRVRGEVVALLALLSSTGIIPAGAGRSRCGRCRH